LQTGPQKKSSTLGEGRWLAHGKQGEDTAGKLVKNAINSYEFGGGATIRRDASIKRRSGLASLWGCGRGGIGRGGQSFSSNRADRETHRYFCASVKKKRGNRGWLAGLERNTGEVQRQTLKRKGERGSISYTKGEGSGEKEKTWGVRPPRTSKKRNNFSGWVEGLLKKGGKMFPTHSVGGGGKQATKE